jgi:ATP-dependent DNA helicase RecG
LQKSLSDSVQYLKGVGPARAKTLARLEIKSLRDLIFFFPRRYEDRRKLEPIASAELGKYQTLRGEISAVYLRRTKRGLSIFEITLADKSGKIRLVWFNQPYLVKLFKKGQELIVYGKIEQFGHLQINNPEYEILRADKDAWLQMGRIVPIYSLTQSLSQRYLRILIKRALDEYLPLISDYLPAEIKNQRNLWPLKPALRSMHFPFDLAALEKARQRIIFDEMFLLELALGLRKESLAQEKRQWEYTFSGKLKQTFLENLPFKLTAGQEKVIREIEQDLASEKPMNRLLQGDVGSGKTVVALSAALVAIQSGYQAVIMAPTEILAQQHFLTVQQLISPLNVQTVLLTSSLKPAQRKQTYTKIKDGSAQLIVGTHSLLEKGVDFQRLALAVVDEQHKFGVAQRSALRDKGLKPDVLVMSATPIPRSLALTLYGDLDISLIPDKPSGRVNVKTLWVSEEDRNSLYEFMKEKIFQGNQAYVVYPLVEASDKIELRAAKTMYKKLKAEVFSQFSVGLIYGAMKSEEKEKTMRLFKEKKIQLLVATVIIESGIDVPQANLMLIEHPERFGLSQLHQLRGRIGRGNEPSWCLLISETTSELAQKRIKAFVELQDGFRLSEIDLNIRGPGEFFGSRQHGEAYFQLADLIKDEQILEDARKTAFALAEKDHTLSKYPLLRKILAEKFSGFYRDFSLVS